jgi:hypothetical protein
MTVCLGNQPADGTTMCLICANPLHRGSTTRVLKTLEGVNSKLPVFQPRGQRFSLVAAEGAGAKQFMAPAAAHMGRACSRRLCAWVGGAWGKRSSGGRLWAAAPISQTAAMAAADSGGGLVYVEGSAGPAAGSFLPAAACSNAAAFSNRHNMMTVIRSQT